MTTQEKFEWKTFVITALVALVLAIGFINSRAEPEVEPSIPPTGGSGCVYMAEGYDQLPPESQEYFDKYC